MNWKPQVEVLLSVLFLIVILYLLNYFGMLSYYNAQINDAFPDTPDISCRIDPDCILAVPSMLSQCEPCDPYGCNVYNASRSDVLAVNKNWGPRCIFSKPAPICIQCVGGVSVDNYTAKCQNEKCVKLKLPGR